MKILLMEKFDGDSYNIPLLNGRDPRLTITNTPNQLRQSFHTGLERDYVMTSTGENSININYSDISKLDPNKRYSFIFTDLLTGIKVTGNSSSTRSAHEERRFVGTLFDGGSSLYRGNGEHILTRYTGGKGHAPYNLELVYDAGKFKVYANDELMSTVDATLGNPLLRLRADGYYARTGMTPYINTYLKYAGPMFKLSGIVIVELEEGESKVGIVRMEDLLIRSVSGNIDNPENVTGPNPADGRYSIIDENGIEIEMRLPRMEDSEAMIGLDYRVSAVATVDKSNVKISVKNGEEDLHEEVRALPTNHNRNSSCMVTPSVMLGASPEDYENLKLKINATEEES